VWGGVLEGVSVTECDENGSGIDVEGRKEVVEADRYEEEWCDVWQCGMWRRGKVVVWWSVRKRGQEEKLWRGEVWVIVM
jgi:hypothetical protein